MVGAFHFITVLLVLVGEGGWNIVNGKQEYKEMRSYQLCLSCNIVDSVHCR